ncbi:uncharacterized protein LOC114761261 [Neltuma alba]|uniref:uncharacterized protein LOC114715687 n=1 Tax=Neltuma alba TaxID=207710 RepID=UPI0010A37963|nr:uncharacterized protein LOC114715687 [Prosopis alba]XP_028806426.1 uncharacterized protein LOC114761261 [Prosopis alba]
MMQSQEGQVPTAAAETASFWTDEKHLQFLNSLEASFVTAMLGNSSSSIHCLRRHLVDVSESTSDLNPHRTASVNYTVSGLTGTNGGRRRRGRRSMRRRSSSQACNSSFQDQVVPQIEIGQQHDITDDSDQASTVD